MLVPITLQPPTRAATAASMEAASYAFLYGFLTALLACNLVLFFGMCVLRYGSHALFLASFMLANVAYTGYGFQWLWPDDTGWAPWAQPTSMMLYAAMGLLFAQSFVDTRRHFVRLHRGVFACIAIGALALIGTMLLDATLLALKVERHDAENGARSIKIRQHERIDRRLAKFNLPRPR